MSHWRLTIIGFGHHHKLHHRGKTEVKIFVVSSVCFDGDKDSSRAWQEQERKQDTQFIYITL
jgi:mannose-6-phosphate isomerase-like protein (cupin superfamily)